MNKGNIIDVLFRKSPGGEIDPLKLGLSTINIRKLPNKLINYLNHHYEKKILHQKEVLRKSINNIM